MDNRRDDILVIGYGLTFIYGIGLFIYLLASVVALFNPHYVLNSSLFAGKFTHIHDFYRQTLVLAVLFLPQWVAAWGVTRLKEWARQLLLAMNMITCIFILYQNLRTGIQDSFLTSVYLMISLVLVLFFSQPRVKAQFFSVAGMPSKRILVIDDDRGLLKLVKTTLGQNGYEVFTATTGEQGIQLARSKMPGLIFLDVLLPGIKGRDVCIKLKEDELTRSIPVVFLTSKDSPDDVRAELSAGGVSHITKPVSSQKLIDEIKRVVGL